MTTRTVITPSDLGAEFSVIGNKLRVVAATASAAGAARQATTAEASAGLAVSAFVTPAQVAAAVATATQPPTIKDDGITVAAALTSMNFVGGGVTATAAGGDVTITVPLAAAGATIDLQDLAGNHVAYAFP